MNKELQNKQKKLKSPENKAKELKNQVLNPTLEDNFKLLQKYKLNIFEQYYEELRCVNYADNFNDDCMVYAVEVAILLAKLEDELEHWMDGERE